MVVKLNNFLEENPAIQRSFDLGGKPHTQSIKLNLFQKFMKKEKL